MSILKEHVCQMEKEQLNSHQSELTSFFLIALDFRAEHSGVSLTVVRGQPVALDVASGQQLCAFVFRTTWRRRRPSRATLSTAWLPW